MTPGAGLSLVLPRSQKAAGEGHLTLESSHTLELRLVSKKYHRLFDLLHTTSQLAGSATAGLTDPSTIAASGKLASGAPAAGPPPPPAAAPPAAAA
eukprot:CAMPEP_0185496154 /NCGR_PEP_ID=MMETSP1366-20130426/18086_1 /TAXON_ID=38817 /ORGANISM="Gephyrocapsa oceanica, Strain RCC1303" /LENGTH=95 /DNA_ID=CAMNT_0028105215 /DNA_START=122 /DNA_END=406 /DNA_ORIENTATION=-